MAPTRQEYPLGAVSKERSICVRINRSIAYTIIYDLPISSLNGHILADAALAVRYIQAHLNS